MHTKFLIFFNAKTILLLIGSMLICGGSSYDEVMETKEMYETHDKILNYAYQSLIRIYDKHEDKEAKDALKQAQLAWLKYRDLTVKAEMSLHKSKLRYYVIMTDVTIDRITRLKDMLTDMSNGSEPDHSDDAKKELEKLKNFETKVKAEPSKVGMYPASVSPPRSGSKTEIRKIEKMPRPNQ